MAQFPWRGIIHWLSYDSSDKWIAQFKGLNGPSWSQQTSNMSQKMLLANPKNNSKPWSRNLIRLKIKTWKPTTPFASLETCFLYFYICIYVVWLLSWRTKSLISSMPKTRNMTWRNAAKSIPPLDLRLPSRRSSCTCVQWKNTVRRRNIAQVCKLLSLPYLAMCGCRYVKKYYICTIYVFFRHHQKLDMNCNIWRIMLTCGLLVRPPVLTSRCMNICKLRGVGYIWSNHRNPRQYVIFLRIINRYLDVLAESGRPDLRAPWAPWNQHDISPYKW